MRDRIVNALRNVMPVDEIEAYKNGRPATAGLVKLVLVSTVVDVLVGVVIGALVF